MDAMMRRVGGLVVVLVAAIAGLSLSGIAAAATGGSGKQQNIVQPAQKKPVLRQVKKDGCADIFKCLFRNSGRRTTGGLGRSFRQVVAFDASRYAPGSIVVRTPERALYFVLPEGEAIRYKVGVGREGFQWSGNSSIVRKEEWPSWTPPQRMIEREAAKGITIPSYMEGGLKNPLGARALYIGGTLFRIHGTNNARTIGGAVSSGCIRMLNGDVVDLYGRVRVGAPVYVYQ
jgi:lipoprotein-anchoring transpeptidase ErfK/SrfK